ncbi:MAG: late competence development ComFB family protein [Burkholderiaceae bacterium]|nr:late competence development ComFB family protein [Burkholderiaceae bacterium]MDH3461919.1 late competence development ComFB family protein [Burkholderiaceae bacterium]
MNSDYESVNNYYERPVFEAIANIAPRFADSAQPESLADVACVALNRLPPRYIRHEADMAFYLTDVERADIERAVDEAVSYAFQFVQARTAMRARS